MLEAVFTQGRFWPSGGGGIQSYCDGGAVLSGENGKANPMASMVSGNKGRGGQSIELLCPGDFCKAGIMMKGNEHIYGKKPIKCAVGHPLWVYYSPETDTYLLEAVETA